MAALLLGAGLLCGACFAPSFGDRQYRCDPPEGSCPAGLTCNPADGYCYAGGGPFPDGDGGPFRDGPRSDAPPGRDRTGPRPDLAGDTGPGPDHAPDGPAPDGPIGDLPIVPPPPDGSALDGPPPTDGGPGPDLVVPSTCRSPEGVPRDSFDGLQTDTGLWQVLADPGVMVQQAKGELIIYLAGMGSGGYRFLSPIDFTGHRAFVEIGQAPLTGQSTMGFSLISNNRQLERAEMVLSSGIIDLALYKGGLRVSLGEVDFDAGAHRFWQIRAAAGSLHLETSPDAVGWETQASVEVDPWITAARVDLSGSLGGSFEDYMSFAGFNTCPVSD